MGLMRRTLVFAAIHMFVVIAVFLLFGLGLEGKRSAGHDLLWFLLEPEASLVSLGVFPPGLQLALLPVNSVVWGLACALAFEGWRRFTTR